MGSISRLCLSPKFLKSKNFSFRKKAATRAPAAIPQAVQETSLTIIAVVPRAAEYIISWGFKRTELIINAANQSSRIPFRTKEAAIGMVPYIQRGDKIPRKLAGTIPRIPQRFPFMAEKSRWILSFANTDTAEPITIPHTQYQKICLSWMSK